MPVQSPSESGLPAVASHGRRCLRMATMPGAGFGALGIYFTRREYRCRPGHHRPGCGGSTPPSRRGPCGRPPGVASIAAMQRSLKPQRCFRTGHKGSTVATHHFGGGTRIEKFMRSLACPARRLKLLPSASSSVSFQRSRSSIYGAPRFERGGCRRESCRECNFDLRFAIYD